MKNSNEGGEADITQSFGTRGVEFFSVNGDWDGDGIDTIGLYEPSTGIFNLKNAN